MKVRKKKKDFITPESGETKTLKRDRPRFDSDVYLAFLTWSPRGSSTEVRDAGRGNRVGRGAGSP